MKSFNVGDRVQFTAACLASNADVIDPAAISPDELRGTVIGIISLLPIIQFDDDNTDTYNAEAFEAI